MITLRIETNKEAPKIAIVGCLHGNETLGLDVYNRIAQDSTAFENLVVVIANIPAYKNGTRYIQDDLNRSFPGDSKGDHEKRLAANILGEVQDADLVIDVHTTNSPGFKAAAITGPLTDQLRGVLATLGIDTAAVMSKELLASSLIGNVSQGLSIEYGEGLIGKQLVDDIVSAIQELQLSLNRAATGGLNEYNVVNVIPKGVVTSESLQNLVYSKELDGYPFILDEKNYTNTRGFLLRKAI